jgi:predicted transcriptional regulator
MAMTIRLTDEETAQLRQQARREGRSVHEVVRLAIQDRIARYDHRERAPEAIRRIGPRNIEVLDRLSDP